MSVQMTSGEPEYQASNRLVEKILQGARDAENEMVARYHKGLVAMLINRSKDRHLAEEVAQDTWLVVLRRVRNNELRDSSKLAAFIVQTGKNQLLMRYRRKKNNTESIDGHLEHADQSPTPEEHLVKKQSSNTVTQLLGELKMKRDREILTQFYYVGESKQAICQKFELSEPHFDRVIFRARERFKTLWNERED